MNVDQPHRQAVTSHDDDCAANTDCRRETEIEAFLVPVEIEYPARKHDGRKGQQERRPKARQPPRPMRPPARGGV